MSESPGKNDSPAKGDAPLKLFISYSHDDEAYREKFVAYLGQLERLGKYAVWEDRQLVAGDKWVKEIHAQLVQTDVFVVLVSPNVFNSKHVIDTEFAFAEELAANGQTRIVPVILEDCEWDAPGSPFAPYQGLPPKVDQYGSISSHPGGEKKAFAEVIKGLTTLYDTIRAERLPAASRNGHPAGTGAAAPQPLVSGAAPVDASPAAATPRTTPTTPRRKGFALAIALVVAIGGGYGYWHQRQEAERVAQAQTEVALGWRLLRIGDYAGAAGHFAHAPKLDPQGAEAARLGSQLVSLGDTTVRRDFAPRLKALEDAAPAGSPVQAYGLYLRAVETFERGIQRQDPAIWLVEANGLLAKAVQIDPQLADAHAMLATLLSLNCQHAEALAVMAQAEAAAADLTPPHYLLEKAQLLQRRDGPGDRQRARTLFDAQHAEPEAQLAGALQDLDAAHWPEARAALASAAKALQAPAPRPAWLVDLPGGPWLLGDGAGKRCAVAYLRTVADALADGKPGLATAWRAVPDCAPVEPSARDLACAHLPDAATGARQALNCPTPQPRIRCPAHPTPPPAS